MKNFEVYIVIACIAIGALFIGLEIGKYRTEKYYRDWLTGWGCGEYYIDGNVARFRLKSGRHRE